MTDKVLQRRVAETAHPTRHWQPLEDGRVECTLCPRRCKMKEGQRGLCFVRKNESGEVVLTSYGRSSGFCVDPIEKKPLNHFLPGSAVLSFGTAGCNLACKYCQNWDMSKSRELDTLMDQASPEALATAARELGCSSAAYTYNDPVIFMEYAIDTAIACREQGIKSVAVTAGYIEPEPRQEFFRYMDAANVDLKSFDEKFYWKLTGGHLEPVLDTLKYIKNETDTWLEVTTLLIPGHNDSEQEIRAECEWIYEHLGKEVPLHFTAFHPDYKMISTPATSPEALRRARDIAMDTGLNYAYTGNVIDLEGGQTLCPGCGAVVIGREGYSISRWSLQDGACPVCQTPIAGVFEDTPGHWGNRRQPVRLSR
ncbi:MAG: AmmeMemoRadiSam system radical SAM enzyme [bacterium]